MMSFRRLDDIADKTKEPYEVSMERLMATLEELKMLVHQLIEKDDASDDKEDE